MFSKIAIIFAALFFALLASAAPAPALVARGGVSQCNTGTLQCCNSVQSSDSKQMSELMGLLGLALTGVGAAVPIGFTCSPITAAGVASNQCTQQPVCCENNQFNGLVAMGCMPVSIAL